MGAVHLYLGGECELHMSLSSIPLPIGQTHSGFEGWPVQCVLYFRVSKPWYGCQSSESRTLTEELQRRIQAIEMRCDCKILCISHKDHVTNEEVRAKIQKAIRPPEDLQTIAKRRKLQWYGHVFRSLGLAKIILHGTVKGGRRQGRQKNRWEDNICEWTGLEFAKSQRAVENWEKMRKLVVKSSVVPKQPSRLRVWWWWWWTSAQTLMQVTAHIGAEWTPLESLHWKLTVGEKSLALTGSWIWDSNMQHLMLNQLSYIPALTEV